MKVMASVKKMCRYCKVIKRNKMTCGDACIQWLPRQQDGEGDLYIAHHHGIFAVVVKSPAASVGD